MQVGHNRRLLLTQLLAPHLEFRVVRLQDLVPGLGAYPVRETAVGLQVHGLPVTIAY